MSLTDALAALDDLGTLAALAIAVWAFYRGKILTKGELDRAHETCRAQVEALERSFSARLADVETRLHIDERLARIEQAVTSQSLPGQAPPASRRGGDD